MANLVVQRAVITGVALSLAAAAPGGDAFPNDGKTYFRIKNAHATLSRTVTFASQLPAGAIPPGTAKTDRAVVVAALTDVLIGGFDQSAFNDANGRVVATYSTEADLSVAAVGG